ncbi:Uncharacterised protein [Vibrio cholerae]|nr:Uncharacterised protein [Vibrio cholerae]
MLALIAVAETATPDSIWLFISKIRCSRNLLSIASADSASDWLSGTPAESIKEKVRAKRESCARFTMSPTIGIRRRK